MTLSSAPSAVIYCRVSSIKQTTKGDGLGSQEARCREYAKYKGYAVRQVFQDDVSGSLIGRPGMQEMLGYLKKKRSKESHIVIIDDISRLARGLEAHIQLRTAISAVGGKLESPSIEFGEDSDSVLVENLLASVSQHQRQKNAEQTSNRMRARAMSGYWVFAKPIGYRYEKVPGHGKMIVKDEPFASIITEALEGFASERLASQADVKRFLECFPEYPKQRNGEVHIQRVKDLLTRPHYAGYIDYPKWGINMIPAKHEPLISLETYNRIQKRLAVKVKTPIRTSNSEDFPLRGYVTCGCCNHTMTSSWSKGRSKHYAYYFCQNKICDEYGKSIARDTMEGEFEELLKSMKPTRPLFEMIKAMVTDLWADRMAGAEARLKSALTEQKKIEREVDQLLDRIVEAQSDSVVSAYEKRIQKLESRKALIAEKATKQGRPTMDLEETYRTAFTFLSNPHKLWASGVLEYRRIVLKLAFAEKLAYVKNEGYRTAAIALPFRLLEGLGDGKKGMVDPAGLEPATSRLEGECSIQLSYGS